MGKEIKKCLIISGAPEQDIDYYKHYINDRYIISADSGYQKCVKLNIEPDLIIGDFDSSKKPETSKKLGRGKHTTRHCELFKCAGGYIADTPGFSSLDIERCEKIMKDELPHCFREFADYIYECKFLNNCSHINDKGCAIRKAVEDGKISESRYNSYVQMYNEVKDIKEWEKK